MTQSPMTEGMALAQALRISDICASPTNPRKTFPEAEHLELTENVKKHGVMQPILVRPWPDAYAFSGDKPKYELIAGERRFRAARAAGLEFIAATVRNLDNNETLELQIVENLHRKDLNELEEAEGYELMRKQYGYTADQLAAKIDKSREYIYSRLKLVALCAGARDKFREGLLTASTALLIARLSGEALQLEAVKAITETWQGALSFREAQKVIQRDFCFYLDKAPFPLTYIDLTIQPDAGDCKTCLKRSGTDPTLYPDIKRADVCTDPACYRAKSAAWTSYQAAEIRQAGKKVITGDEAEKINIEHSNNKYIKLDDPNYQHRTPDNTRYLTNREVLDKLKDSSQPPEALFVENSRNGGLVEVIEASKMKLAMQAAGLAVQQSSTERDKETERAVREENKFRQRLFEATHEAMREHLAGEFDLNSDEMALVARHFWSCLGSDSQGRAAHHWTHEGDEKESHERRHAMVHRVTDRIPNMSRADLCLFLLDLSLIGQSKVDTWQWPNSKCTDLLATAKSAGIDPDEVRQAMETEKATKKKKPASEPSTATAPEAASEPTWLPKKGDAARVKPDTTDIIAQVFAGAEGVISNIGHSLTTNRAIYTLQANDGRMYSCLELDHIEPMEATSEPTPLTFISATSAIPTKPEIGVYVRINADAKKMGSLRKCCGREGVIEATFMGGTRFAVRFGPGKDYVSDMKRNEFALIASPNPTSANATDRCPHTLELPIPA